MSLLHAVETSATREKAPHTPPYVRGDRITATSPEGQRFLVRVEAVTPTESGEFNILGAVMAPRRFRSHVLSTVVGADGFGPAVHPAC